MTIVETTDRQTRADANSERPSVRRRGLVFWGVMGIILLVVGAIISFSRPSVQDALAPSFSPDSASPLGARAVAEVLRDQGVTITRTESRADAAKASAGATIVVPNTPALSDAGFEMLIAKADIVILILPTSAQLASAFDGSTAGYASENVSPACTNDLVSDLGPATIGSLYEVSGATACYATDSGAGVIFAQRGEQTIIAFDGSAVMTNERVGDAANAALVLRILAQNDRIVWYVATVADSDLGSAEGDATLGSRTPSWVTPTIALLGLAGLAAIWWRGKRFGPLVAENLPVTVKISETLEGRAKIYAQNRDSAHTGRVLRTATAQRVAQKLGMSQSSSTPAICAAVSGVLATRSSDIEQILAGPPPSSDADLMQLSDRLNHLEAAVTAAFRSERNPS